jgi:hypothetical protein
MTTLRRFHVLALLLFSALASPALVHAQQTDTPEEIVRAYFDGKNRAPALVTVTCPGEDASNDAVVTELTRQRPEEETRRLAKAWVYVPPCNERAPYVLGTVLGVVTTVGGDRFGPRDRQRIWDLMEPRLESLPPEMRSAIESHEADLNVAV